MSRLTPTMLMRSWAIGDAYFQVGDHTNAVDCFRKAITADPTNVGAPLAYGAATFNNGDLDSAEMHWKRAVMLEPDNVEAHYDTGFLYLNREPPDKVGVQREWGEVIRLAPDTEIAKTVQTHLDALLSPAPSTAASPAPVGASPAPAGAGPAPAATVTPAPTVTPAAVGSARP